MANTMTVAPVLLFTYSRPEHTRTVLKALEENDMADRTAIYAYTCEPKKAEHASAVSETKDVLKEFQKKNGFLSFEIVDPGKHVHLGPGMISAVTGVLAKHDKVIIIEDDIVTSKDFLRFMNEGLDFYQDDLSVFTVAGYSPKMPEIAAMEKDVYMIHRTCPWGWGTWKERWDCYDPEIRTFISNMLDRRYRRSLTKWTPDLPLVLDIRLFAKGIVDIDWEMPLGFCQFNTQMNTVCPKFTKVKNIGFDGTGANPTPKGLDSSFEEGWSGNNFEHLQIDEKFLKRYNRLFIYRTRTRIMIRLTNLIHLISPSLYYRILNIYCHNDIKVKDLMAKYGSDENDIQ